MNHYPRHVGDIISATVGLSLMERGAYSALLDQYYLTERPLPLDRREIYRMAACTTTKERKAIDYVLVRHFSECDDGWHQKRCDEEIAAYRVRVDIARENGSHGGRPKTKSVIPGLAKETQSKANHKPVTSNQEPGVKLSARGAPALVRPTDEHEGIAAERGINCQAEFEKYRDWQAATGKVHKDPVAGFRNWLRNARPTATSSPLSVTGNRTAQSLSAWLEKKDGTNGP